MARLIWVTKKAPVPALFGMNFQAVSVGEKLIEKGVYGGYTDAAADPTPSLISEFTFVDGAIGQMVQALKSQNLLDSTTIIITAKHGQSPIAPSASCRSRAIQEITELRRPIFSPRRVSSRR